MTNPRLFDGLPSRAKAGLLFLAGTLMILTPPILDVVSCRLCGGTHKAGVYFEPLDPLASLWRSVLGLLSSVWFYALAMPQWFALQLVGVYLILRGIRLLLERSTSPSAKRVLKLWTG